MRIKYNDGQPCTHVGCLSHISHPCEECGRIGGKGIVYCDERIEFKNGSVIIFIPNKNTIRGKIRGFQW